MNHSLRLLLWLLLIPALLILSSCGNTPGRAALLHYNGADPFIAAFVERIEANAAGRLELEIYDAENVQVLQNEQLEAVLQDPPQVLIVNPVDRLSAYATVRQAKALGVPVIFFNREPLRRDLEEWERSYYVGARAEQSARLQAQLVIELFGGNPRSLNQHDRNGDNVIQTIILKGEQGHQDAEIRTSEVLQEFNRSGFRVEVLTTLLANWNQNQAYELMEAAIAEHRQRIELVLSNNDAMALGAIQRMRQVGLLRDTDNDGSVSPGDDRWIPVVGIDGIAAAVSQIESGYLYGTVQNDSLSMADAIVELAVILADGREPGAGELGIEDEHYIWIDYRPFVLSESER